MTRVLVILVPTAAVGALALRVPPVLFTAAVVLLVMLVCRVVPSEVPRAPAREETAEDWDWPRWAA